MQWVYLDANQNQVPFDKDTQLAVLLEAGTINNQTMIWYEGLDTWRPLSDLVDVEVDYEEPAQTVHPSVSPNPLPATAAPVAAAPVAAAPTAYAPPATVPAPTTHQPAPSGRIAGSAAAAGKAMSGKGGDVAVVKYLAMAMVTHAGWVKFAGVMMIIAGVLTCLSISGIIIGWLPIWMGVVLCKAANLANEASARGSKTLLFQAIERLGFYFKLTGILTIIMLVLYIVLIIFVIIAIGSVGLAGATMGDPSAF
ncbi:MAG: DUF5362 family protein [Verrucomicrobiota bacterium]